MGSPCEGGEISERAALLLAPGENGSLWLAFHSRPRCEKKAASACLDLGLRHFLPLRENVTRRQKRRYSFFVPLFPGYLFACCHPDERLSLMQSGYMVKSIDVVDQRQLLTELTGIYVACRSGVSVSLYPLLKRGRVVRVSRGPLAGVHGKISQRKESFRLVLNISALGTAVAVEVDMHDVDLVDQ